MQTNKTHWSSTLTLGVFGISLLFFLLVSFGAFLGSLIDLVSGGGNPVGEIIVAFSFGFNTVLLGLCAWFVLQKNLGRGSADQPLRFPFALWHIAALLGVMFLGALIGGLITLTEMVWLGWLTLPLLTVLVIVPPIWLLFGIGSHGLDAGPRWRFFSVFGLSLTLAPFLMIALEMVVLVAGIVAVSVYIALFQPDIVLELAELPFLLESGADEEALLSLLAPYIANPYVITAALGYIAVLVPLIEELLKPLAVWLFGKQLGSPAQGFVLGMLSGAAFALFESLNASADGSSGWAVIVSVRAGTSILHIAASGLVGWGIASAFTEKRYGRLIAAYLTAVLVHGVWNAAAVGTGISAIGDSIGRPEWLYAYAPALVCGMLVMGVGMVAVLIASNRKLKMTEIRVDPQEQVQSSP